VIRQFIKSILLLAALLLLLLAVQHFAFTLYTVPCNGMAGSLIKGDRVLVNRLSNAPLRKADYIVYTDSTSYYIARIVAVPGDTVRVGHNSYVIPQICCSRCGCPDCKYYLISSGGRQWLLHRHLIVGRAVKIYHLPF